MPSEIPFIRPTFPDPSMVAAEYEEIVRSNWFTNFGPKERRFTQALAEYIGNECAVATFANGSLALLAAIHSSTGYGSRDKYRVAVGGGPINAEYAKKIGADGYSRTAHSAVAMAKRLMEIKPQQELVVELG